MSTFGPGVGADGGARATGGDPAGDLRRAMGHLTPEEAAAQQEAVREAEVGREIDSIKRLFATSERQLTGRIAADVDKAAASLDAAAESLRDRTESAARVSARVYRVVARDALDRHVTWHGLAAAAAFPGTPTVTNAIPPKHQ